MILTRKKATEAVWHIPLVSLDVVLEFMQLNEFTTRPGRTAGKKHQWDICTCKVSQFQGTVA
jgi:hypothetical protein